MGVHFLSGGEDCFSGESDSLSEVGSFVVTLSVILILILIRILILILIMIVTLSFLLLLLLFISYIYVDLYCITRFAWVEIQCFQERPRASKAPQELRTQHWRPQEPPGPSRAPQELRMQPRRPQEPPRGIILYHGIMVERAVLQFFWGKMIFRAGG